MTRQIVLDTNVFVAALISKRGAAYKLLSLIDKGMFEIHLSVPLVLEYEEVAKRLSGSQIALTLQEIDDVIDYLCALSRHRQVYFLWRPFLSDPSDDMLLELAVSADCEFIVTYNIRDFEGTAHFGVQAVTPKSFLELIGELK